MTALYFVATPFGIEFRFKKSLAFDFCKPEPMVTHTTEHSTAQDYLYSFASVPNSFICSVV